jgi:hypothetical protein
VKAPCPDGLLCGLFVRLLSLTVTGLELRNLRMCLVGDFGQKQEFSGVE